ncbi:hypothetical protein [Schaalia hyovaginalis]|uniref:hypothetical protein n=1 Tax=Schaalia hyovaginalis TaxID=29316 RepID=UPI0026ED5451|nr:hypothetical protein [Schaalia hyovaginalis]MCI6556216.1 hypothetical protein [Schaalia hyovaginalis]
MIRTYEQRIEYLAEIRAARREAEEAQLRADEAQARLKRLTIQEWNSFGVYCDRPLADLARAAGSSRKTLYAWKTEAAERG